MQRAINMHNSQISHGVVGPDEFLNDALNRIVTGYTPSMIKIFTADADMDPVEQWAWYSTLPDVIFSGNGMVPTFVATTEKGFVVGGAELIAAGDGDRNPAAGFIWESYGCDNDGDYLDEMHPDEVDAGEAMPQIDPYLPPIQALPEVPTLSDETDIQVNTLAADYVDAIDNTALTITVAAATTVAQMISELESTDGSVQTYNVYDDNGSGAPDMTDELTGATALTTGDHLIVTAADGTANAVYAITVAA